MGKVGKKVLLLSTSDKTGADEAIYRISQILIKMGCQVVLLVQRKTKSDIFIKEYKYEIVKKFILFRIVSKIIYLLGLKKNDKSVFDSKYYFFSKDESSINISANSVVERIGFNPDIIITGMTSGFFNSTDLLNLYNLTHAQIYNITVDMNHFTGGCHYAWDCKGYINGCTSSCPAIISSNDKNIAKRNFENKRDNVKKGNFKIITGSQWTLDQAKKSLLYKNQDSFLNINSVIDVNLFNSKNRKIAKSIFDLIEDKFYILMGCNNAKDPHKGFEYLVEALKIVYNNLDNFKREKIQVLIVSKHVSDDFSGIPFEKKHIDYIKDYRLLSLLYQATDLFVNSSIEDAGPMMVSEALACGTPVVGFDMGIVTNMVIDDFNGYKAVLKDSNDLANGILKILNLSEEDYSSYSKNSVKQIEKYSSFNYVENELLSILK